MTILAAGLAGLIVLLATMTIAWAVSVRMRDASIADLCWGPGFALLAWLYCVFFSSFGARPLLVALLLTTWGTRLAVHILRRHRGEDPRYQSMRASHGDAFWWRSLFIVFWLQAAILWFVALPVLIAVGTPRPVSLTAMDVAGLFLFVVGFAFEAIGDSQLARFRARPSNRGRVLETGLWRYTRHPNYFGDALLWWGVYLMAASTANGWLTVGSPALMTWLLLRVSGVTLLERGLSASRPGYADYVARTSSFIPWFPRRS